MGVDRGIPNLRFPPPLPPLPFPSPPASLPLIPHFPPLRIFLPPPSKKNKNKKKKKKNNNKKKQVTSSYNPSFQCMDYYQGFKTVGQFVCSSVHLLVCFGVLQPSQRPSRQHCGEMEKSKEDRIGERKNASTAGPCPTITQNNKTPRHCKLPSTISRPNRKLKARLSCLRP